MKPGTANSEYTGSGLNLDQHTSAAIDTTGITYISASGLPAGVTIYDGIWDGSGDVGSLTAISKKGLDGSSYSSGAEAYTPSSSNAGGVTIVVEKGVGLDYTAIFTTFQATLGSLVLRPPEDFSGVVDITASIRTQNDSEVATDPIENHFQMNVVSKAEPVSGLSFSVKSGSLTQEDAAVELDLSFNSNDVSETQTAKVTGLVFTDSNNMSQTIVLQDASGNAIGDTDGLGTTTLTSTELTSAKANGLKIMPPANFFGNIENVAITVTSQDLSGDYVDVVNNLGTVSLSAVSEEPDVDISGDLSGTEDTTADTASGDGVALTNVTLSIADSEAVATADGKILIANTNDSALSGVRINTTGLTDGGITVSASGNAGEWTVTGATSVSQLQSAIQQLKVVGPEDYAGAMKVTVSARAAESGVDASPYASGNFTVNLSAVAEAPTLLVSNITDAVEDAAKALNASITMAAVDKDGSDEIISVQITGLSFESNGATLQAAIVDSSGNSVGIPDGSGGVTLTKAQYDAGVKLQPPANYFGDIAVGVTATTRDGTSCLLYTSPSPRDRTRSRMPSSA